MDLQLNRIAEACERTDTILLIVADHGNADQMLEKAKNDGETVEMDVKKGKFGLANVAPAILTLPGIPAPDCWEESVICF